MLTSVASYKLLCWKIGRRVETPFDIDLASAPSHSVDLSRLYSPHLLFASSSLETIFGKRFPDLSHPNLPLPFIFCLLLPSISTFVFLEILSSPFPHPPRIILLAILRSSSSFSIPSSTPRPEPDDGVVRSIRQRSRGRSEQLRPEDVGICGTWSHLLSQPEDGVAESRLVPCRVLHPGAIRSQGFESAENAQIQRTDGTA